MKLVLELANAGLESDDSSLDSSAYPVKIGVSPPVG